MHFLRMWGIVCLLVVCPLAGSARAGCDTNVGALLDTGLGKLRGDTMDLPAALAEFNSAINMDSTCGPLLVSRALVKLWMIYDTPAVASLRGLFGDTTTIDLMTRDTFSSNAYDTYNFNPSTMNGSNIQALLSNTIVPILNVALTDLIAAESVPDTGFNFRVPARFIAGDTGGPDTVSAIADVEVDIADVYMLHGMILVAKAAIEIANSWRVDLSQDLKNFRGNYGRGGDSSSDTIFEEFRNNPTFFERKTTWDTAFRLFHMAETGPARRFFQEVRRETDAQDSDLVRHDTSNTKPKRQLIVWDHVNDHEADKFDTNHPDTFARVFAGQTIQEHLKDGIRERPNADLDTVSYNFSALFSSPFSRNSVPSDPNVLARGFEWTDATFFPDPTFSNFLPGMTSRKIFLLKDDVDTYKTLTAYSDTWDIDSMPHKKPKVIDIKFNVTGGPQSPISIKYSPPGRKTQWTFSVTPKSTSSEVDPPPAPPHLRIFFNPDMDAFGGHEQRGLQSVIDSTFILVVPWASLNKNAVDAGSDFPGFISYYSLAAPNTIKAVWEGYSADTLIFYKFDGFGFLPLEGTQVYPDSPVMGRTTLTSPVDTGVFLTGFNWFVIGEARPRVLVNRGFLLGDKSTALPQTFKIELENPLNKSTAGEPVKFKIVVFPTGATTGSFTAVPGFPFAGGTSAEPIVITDTNGHAEVQYVMGNGGGIYIIEARAGTDGSGANAFLFALTKGYSPFPGNAWRMVSAPLYPDTPLPTASVDTVIGRAAPTMSVSQFVTDDFPTHKIYYWDPAQTNSDPKFAGSFNHYVAPSSIQMGRAYWLLTTANGVLDAVRSDSSDIYAEIKDTVYLPLHIGANMIGVPFSHPLRSSKLMVQPSPSASSILTIDSASSYVEHRLWWITPTVTANGTPTQAYVSGGTAAGASYREMALFPFEGYWLKAFSSCAPCTLIFPPIPADSLPLDPSGVPIVTGGGAGGATAAPVLRGAPPLLSSAGAGSPDNWTVQLIAQSEGGIDVENLAGVRPAGSPHYMAASSDPPMAPGLYAVALAFVEADQRYSTLFKSLSEEPAWTLDVTSRSAGQVSLRPSDLSSVPAGAPVMLRDETTGKVIDLRQDPGYSYFSAANETRRFTFAASTLRPGFFQSIAYPEVSCLAVRLFGLRAGCLDVLRTLRDCFLDSTLGRSFVSLYYQ